MNRNYTNVITVLGTGDTTKTDEFSENLQRDGGRGGGLFSIQKFMLQILDLYTDFFSMNLKKKLHPDTQRQS